MNTKEETQGSDPIVVIAGRGEFACLLTQCWQHQSGALKAFNRRQLHAAVHSLLTPSCASVSALNTPQPTLHSKDSCTRETGLYKAVATMRPNERAWVYITDYKYGYGEKGSFSFPSVPPACQLVYDVTMVASEPPEEVRSE